MINRKEKDHVGKKFLMIDIDSPVSPALRAIVHPGTDPEQLSSELNTKLLAVFDEVLGQHGIFEWSVKPLHVTIRAETILPPEEQSKKDDELRQRLQRSFQEAESNLEQELDNHPQKETKGWWLVVGIRHSAVVEAVGPKNAIKTAIDEGLVGDWEIVTVPGFLGTEMPRACGL